MENEDDDDESDDDENDNDDDEKVNLQFTSQHPNDHQLFTFDPKNEYSIHDSTIVWNGCDFTIESFGIMYQDLINWFQTILDSKREKNNARVKLRDALNGRTLQILIDRNITYTPINDEIGIWMSIPDTLRDIIEIIMENVCCLFFLIVAIIVVFLIVANAGPSTCTISQCRYYYEKNYGFNIDGDCVCPWKNNSYNDTYVGEYRYQCPNAFTIPKFFQVSCWVSTHSRDWKLQTFPLSRLYYYEHCLDINLTKIDDYENLFWWIDPHQITQSNDKLVKEDLKTTLSKYSTKQCDIDENKSPYQWGMKLDEVFDNSTSYTPIQFEIGCGKMVSFWNYSLDNRNYDVYPIKTPFDWDQLGWKLYKEYRWFDCVFRMVE